MGDSTIIIGVILLLLASILVTLSQLKQDVDRINKTLLKLVSESKPEDLEKINQELIELLKSDKTVKAVKRYRELTGLGLLEAKQYVDSLKENLEKEN